MEIAMTRSLALAALLALTPLASPPALAATPTCDAACVDARLRRIEDERAIERLLVEYGRTLDNRDFAAWSALFTEDGEWQGAQGGYKGRAQLRTSMEKIFTDAAADIPKGRNFHAMSNFIIDVQGDRATASSKFVFYKLDGSKPVAEVAGRYEDVLARVGGSWKFQKRRALGPG
jgi:uncharacterized protein (TIGR02246 family)